MAIYELPAGLVVKINGEKVQIDENVPVPGTLIPEAEKKQKTYMRKAECPSCKRIVRVTAKHWTAGPIVCAASSHSDAPACFVLDEGDGTDGTTGGDATTV